MIFIADASADDYVLNLFHDICDMDVSSRIRLSDLNGADCV